MKTKSHNLYEITLTSKAVDSTEYWTGFEFTKANPGDIRFDSKEEAEREFPAAVAWAKASSAGWIWLGIDDPQPQIMKSHAQRLGMKLPPGEVTGWMPYPLPQEVHMTTRMHLNEAQVRGIIARLQAWLETGSLTPTKSLDQ